jgi:hypothetical protein
LIRLLRYAMSQQDDRVAGPILRAVQTRAWRVRGPDNWAPTEILFEAVETARSGAARWEALSQLTRAGTAPEVRARLLVMLRRPAGPPAWPNLPSDVVAEMIYMPWEGARLLDAELLAAPDRVRNPLAHWLVECGRSPEGPPLLSTDPCHPQNAPPRIGLDEGRL